MQTVIDPDSGWQFGFPKLFDPDEGQSTDHWLLMNGYPLDLIDMWQRTNYKSVPCRMWGINEV